MSRLSTIAGRVAVAVAATGALVFASAGAANAVAPPTYTIGYDDEVVAYGTVGQSPELVDDAQTAASAGVFIYNGDPVKMSGSNVVVGTGWWVRVSGPAKTARVSVAIQQHWGTWQNVGGGSKVTSSGSGNKATGRAGCVNYPGHGYHWRSVIDVDIIGYSDPGDVKVTPEQRLTCSAFGRG